VVDVLVIHHRWGYGGSETVFYYTIKALADAGFNVTITTLDPPDFTSYTDIIGESLPNSIKFIKAPGVNVKMLTIYKPLLSWRQSYDDMFDAIIVTHGYPYIWSGKAKTPIIFYMHFPAILITDRFWNPEGSRYELRSPTHSGIKSFTTSILWWLYIQPFKFIVRGLYEKYIKSFSRILVNSTYTLRAFKYTIIKYVSLEESIRDLLSRTSILYPPLPRVWELLRLRDEVRIPCVATIGRFSPEKRYDLILEIAKILPRVKFIVAGGVYGRTSRAYYEWIKSRASENVVVRANISTRTKNLILSRCTVYLHTMVGEHFGLAPLEALASGMTPVVPERSGTWSDICNNGNYCYGYKKPNPEELEEAVRRALEKPLIAPEDHVKKFAPDTFAKGILSVVKEVLNERRYEKW